MSKLTEHDLDRQIAFKAPKPLNPELLLASGAIEGPGRPTRPLTVSRLQRLRRRVRALLFNWRTTP